MVKVIATDSELPEERLHYLHKQKKFSSRFWLLLKMKAFSSSLRVTVLGAKGVGKSAITVRYLTKRFIGEYSSGLDISYQTTVKHEDTPIKVDILDTSHQDECQPSCHDVYDADAFIVVYSITDTASFRIAREELGRIRSGSTVSAPILLLGNKIDLDHVRKVPLDHAYSAAEESSCLHVEVSAAESHAPIGDRLHGLFLDAVASLCHRGRTVKRRKSLFENVSKKLGSVFRMRSLEDGGGSAAASAGGAGGGGAAAAAGDANKQKMMQVCHLTANRRSV